MAKFPTFDTIVAAFASASKLNANFTEIVTSFTNTISRDGSTPNTMLADFDMNSNDILNAGNVAATDITVGGVSIATQVTAAATSATNAATSETNAATSETNAATSETNAAASAAALETINFDTVALFAAATIDAGVNAIRTSG